MRHSPRTAPPRRKAAYAALATLAGLTLLLATPAATATSTDAGLVRVSSSATANAAVDLRLPTHVACDLSLDVYVAANADLTVALVAIPPTGNGELLAVVNATTDAEGHAHVGPLNLTATGHVRADVRLGEMTSTTDVAGDVAASATFWVDPCGAPPLTIPCVDLTATAEASGSIRLDLDASAAASLVAEATATPDAAVDGVADAGAGLAGTAGAAANATGAGNASAGLTAVNVYRAEAGGAFELVATLDADASVYVDANVTAGVTYSYLVTVMVDGQETLGCNPTEVTPIPEFPSMAVAGMAGILGLAAYAAIRRRQA